MSMSKEARIALFSTLLVVSLVLVVLAIVALVYVNKPDEEHTDKRIPQQRETLNGLFSVYLIISAFAFGASAYMLKEQAEAVGTFARDIMMRGRDPTGDIQEQARALPASRNPPTAAALPTEEPTAESWWRTLGLAGEDPEMIRRQRRDAALQQSTQATKQSTQAPREVTFAAPTAERRKLVERYGYTPTARPSSYAARQAALRQEKAAVKSGEYSSGERSGDPFGWQG